MAIDITFTHPAYVWYLLSIPLLIVTHYLFLHHTKRKAMHFANFEALKRVTGKKLLTTHGIELVLRLLVILCLVLAVAGTTFWYETNAPDNDFVLAIDISASMSAEDITATRLDAAKRLSEGFVDELHASSHIGVVSFATVPLIEQLPTRDSISLKTSINKLSVEKSGGTDIAAAIITSTNILLSSKKGKAIILLTDGSNTYNTFIEDSINRGVNYALEKKIIIHTLGIGRESAPIGYLPEYYNISATFNEDLLIRIANETGGSYYIAKDDAAFTGALDYLIDRSQKRNVPIDLSFGLLLVGIMLLFIEWGLLNTRFRKIP
jgi:Ca-activated chloride channel family protein